MKIHSLYFYFFAAIITLPLFILPPFVTSPDWDKTIVFRCLASILLALFIWQQHKNNSFLEIKQKIESINGLFWALAALFLIFLLATIFSQDVSFSLWGSPYRAGGFVTYSFYIFFALLAFFIIKPGDWEKLLNWSLVVGWAVGLIAVFQNFSIFSSFLHPYPGSPPATTGNSSFLAIYILLMLFIALGFFFKNALWRYRFLYGVTALFFFFVMLISRSRSSYLGFFIGFAYFLFFYPQKNWKVKFIQTAGACLIALSVLFIVYVNVSPNLAPALQNNKIASQIVSRLSLKLLAGESRFSAWKISLEAVKDRPVLGWGPENLEIGFNKFYNPALPEIAGLWWDRAHNIFLDTAASEGLFGLAAYLFFFALLFWQLQRMKKQNFSCHIIQSALLAYFTANFFSFDSFVAYIIIFFLIGYSFSLVQKPQEKNLAETNIAKRVKFIPILTAALLFIFIVFFNILPYNTGRAAGLAQKIYNQGGCQKASALMEKTIKEKNYANVYAKEKYAEILKQCGLQSTVQQGVLYIKRGVEVLNDAAKYDRKSAGLWVVQSTLGNILLENEQDPQKKQQLSLAEKDYIKKGLELSPKRQELLMEQAKNLVLDGDYKTAISVAQNCIKIYDKFGGCYWFSGLANIYLGNQDEGKKQLQESGKNNYVGSLQQIAEVYIKQNNYKELENALDDLVRNYPNIIEYRAFYAFVLKKNGNYKLANEEAGEVIKQAKERNNQEAIKEADIFIKSLPVPYNKY